MKHASFRINKSKQPLNCFFCGRDLSEARVIKYVDEGPICSICVAEHALNAQAKRNQNRKTLAGETPTRAQTRKRGLR